MSRIKKILLALLVVFIAIQFIQPAHNKSKELLATDFNKLFAVPDTVTAILQNACYDCHSNNSGYPWYSNIQPMAWMMARHIKNGKEELNFNEFGSYTSRRQISKLMGIANQIKDDEMPLSSYKMMHKKANLTKEEKVLIMDWMNNKADSLSANN
ncbi:MAG: heme-binding domain-containing protein [Chitinophagaceae bacterium]|nr:heme-binding domain-containing protein [Chitinophagaceae bacterium]